MSGEWLVVAERALAAAERAGGEGIQVLVSAEDSALTRFANNEIHQNVAESDASLNLRVVLGHRSGVANTDRLDDDGLRRAAETAVALARLSEERDEPIAIPEPTDVSELAGSYSEATAAATPELRASAASTIIATATDSKLTAFGSVSTSREAIAVATSTGIRVEQRRTAARVLTVLMTADGGSGYAESGAVAVASLDARALGLEAARRAVRSRGAVAVEPGDYRVVLEPYAVADLLGTLAYIGFSALAVEEGRSFFEPGRQVGSELVSIWDDGRDPAGLPMVFDFEGVAKQRVGLVERGICGEAVYDAQTALRAGRQSTGHGLPPPNTFGPLPMNMFMAAGSASAAELLAGIDRGLLVTRFWYTNPVHPKLAIATGMTRDGTFLIERGEVVGPVRNLRFTTSYVDALRTVSAVGDERRTLDDGFGASVVPAIRVDSFTFTGVTEH